MYREHYSRSLSPSDSPHRPLHFAAHSHHPWPDVTRQAVLDYWDDSARLLDAKWDHVFGAIIPEAQNHVAQWIKHPRPQNIVFGQNTLELVWRAMSSLCEEGRPKKILTTDSEFYSFDRLASRLSETPQWEVVRVPVEPFDTFTIRMLERIQSGSWDVVYLSHVFFNSGFYLSHPETLVRAATANPHTRVFVDAYHCFGALPFEWSQAFERVYYMAGGYKYAQSGEGVCWMTVPLEGILGFEQRPLTTGWLTGWKHLSHASTASKEGVPYGDDAFRYVGATFDPTGLYRLNRVFSWLQSLGLNPQAVHGYVRELQNQWIQLLQSSKHRLWNTARLVVDPIAQTYGHFTTHEADSSEDAARVVAGLKSQGITVDHRGARIRVGFGLYQNNQDVAQLASRLFSNPF